MQEKCVISREVALSQGPFAPGHLGEPTRIVDFDLVDAVLEETGKTQKRVRLLPSRVVVYFVLALALFERVGYRGVWSKLVAGLDGLPVSWLEVPAVPVPALAGAGHRLPSMCAFGGGAPHPTSARGQKFPSESTHYRDHLGPASPVTAFIHAVRPYCFLFSSFLYPRLGGGKEEPFRVGWGARFPAYAPKPVSCHAFRSV
ncbi:transposase domain-containing protein [Streptomyces sp. NPDC057910]|uniref:transposase domain-containing protein n=1 Tax=Streptomyces sp. NPDC057910 TaxID=3346278 RepID=UPI0036E00577